MARSMTRLSHIPVDHRVLRGAFSRLEPCAVKVARTVLRGRGDGNVTLLPDYAPSLRSPWRAAVVGLEAAAGVCRHQITKVELLDNLQHKPRQVLLRQVLLLVFSLRVAEMRTPSPRASARRAGICRLQ